VAATTRAGRQAEVNLKAIRSWSNHRCIDDVGLEAVGVAAAAGLSGHVLLQVDQHDVAEVADGLADLVRDHRPALQACRTALSDRPPGGM
jgi:hypothetical protein